MDHIWRWNTMPMPVGFLTQRSMPRLTAIVPLLCLALSGVQAKQLCGNNRRSECVRHHLCDISYENGGPILDFSKVQRGNQGCASTESCCPADKILQENENKTWTNPTERNDCGQVNENGLTFTMRSADGLAQENEFPWMTALMDVNNTFLGGGSLVALDVVLTASHITRNFESGDIWVRAGEWDMFTESEKFPHVDVAVRMIVRHPLFNISTGANNLALLFLEEPLQASPHIRPICLPSFNENFDQKQCIVNGWGKDAIKQNSFMNIMKKVDLPVVNSSTCELQLQRHKAPSFRLHNSLMCAGGEDGRDACTGDGGSPLACPLSSDPKRFQQAGIVNWGIGCGQANTPAVYTNVAMFRNWIDEQIKAHSNANDERIFDDDNLMSASEDPIQKDPNESQELNMDEFFESPTEKGNEVTMHVLRSK